MYYVTAPQIQFLNISSLENIHCILGIEGHFWPPPMSPHLGSTLHKENGKYLEGIGNKLSAGLLRITDTICCSSQHDST